MGSARIIHGLTCLVIVAIVVSAASPAFAARNYVPEEGTAPLGLATRSEQGADQQSRQSALAGQASGSSVVLAMADQALTATVQPTPTLPLTATMLVTSGAPLEVGGALDVAASITSPVQTVTTDPPQMALSEVTTDSVTIVDPIPAQVNRMSSVRGAQTSLFTRSIVYSHGFTLPPGRGGLTPVLGLNYNSASHSQHQGHYSYVGHGWDLAGADYIFRYPGSISEGLGSPHADEKVTMSLQGRTYTLQGIEDPITSGATLPRRIHS